MAWSSLQHSPCLVPGDLSRLTTFCRTRRIYVSLSIAGDNPCRRFSVSTTLLSPRMTWKQPASSTTSCSVPGRIFNLVRQIALGGALLSIHQVGSGLDLVVKHPTVGGADICLRWSGGVESAVELLRQHEIPNVDGPSPRRTADGLPAHSIYFRDPDGNLVELMAPDMWPASGLIPAVRSWPPELDVAEMLGNDTSTIYTTTHSGRQHHDSGEPNC
jgi:hypothetical protein